MKTLILTPAYGRDYKSKAQLMQDWDAGKDFVVQNIERGGTYVSKNDLPADVTTVQFRYNRLDRIHVLKIRKA